MPVIGIRPKATSINAGLSPIPSAPNVLHNLSMLARPVSLPRAAWLRLRAIPIKSVRGQISSCFLMSLIEMLARQFGQ
jgi:hypothetical protein